jgi:hypothetical protein
MPMTFCPDCNADLEAVPLGFPCPGCGGNRRAAVVGLPPATATGEAGEIGFLVNEALAELEALPAETAHEVAVGFTRYAAMAMSGRMIAAGFDPRDAPAFYRLWRALPGSARVALMATVLVAAPVASGGLQEAGADLYRALKSAIRSIAAEELAASPEREPTPAPPLPRLVTAEDAVCDPSEDNAKPDDGRDYTRSGK